MQLESLSRNDLLNQYITISDREYICEVQKVKGKQSLKIPPNSIIMFESNNDDHIDVDGSKDDLCNYNNGILLGMIKQDYNVYQNVDINIRLEFYQKTGGIECRELAASYFKSETYDYDEWRFWLLTTGDDAGFYIDFRQDSTYIIFPTHPSYEMFKHHYELPKLANNYISII